MSPPVFYLADASGASVGSEVVVAGAEGHHAAVVRRVRVGEAVILTDGRGNGLDADVVAVGRRDLTCAVKDLRVEPAPALSVCVVQALPKGDRGERAVAMLTEVGVQRIVPWQAERSVSRWRGDTLERGLMKWQASASEAAKQSRRLRWPQVERACDTDAIASYVSEATASFVLHEAASESWADLIIEGGVPDAGSVVLVIGPEGGVSDDELAVLGDAGASAVKLGGTVLRTSTAGVVAAALVLATTAPWRSTLGGDEGSHRD